MSTEAFFQLGRNCDSVRHADRFSLLIDGADYFRVLREAIARAQCTMFILGWDINSRMSGASRFRSHRAMTDNDPWPPSHTMDLENVDIAISLTEPVFSGRPGLQQIRQQYLDAIALLKRSIYIENQYFTAGSIGGALRETLENPDGPDLAIAIAIAIAAQAERLAPENDNGGAARTAARIAHASGCARPVSPDVAERAGVRNGLRERAQQIDAGRR